ncbi:hypothetical protein J6590_067885 [Homalodisca vitripennis]|nr:hypothetical protein J6590_067885 [Homalodisca vitripennis]
MGFKNTQKLLGASLARRCLSLQRMQVPSISHKYEKHNHTSHQLASQLLSYKYRALTNCATGEDTHLYVSRKHDDFLRNWLGGETRTLAREG